MTRTVIFLVFFLFALPPAAWSGLVEGIVFSEKGPLENAEVHAYPDYRSFITRTNARVSKPGEAVGEYRLTLEDGFYFLVAFGRQDGRPLMGYHGANPQSVTEQPLWLPFMATPAEEASCGTGIEPGLQGRVTFKGRPVSGGQVSLYPVSDERFRGMGLLTESLDAEGRFRFKPEEGTYVVVGRRRQNAATMGPLEKGDLYCYYAGNPVQIGGGGGCSIEVACYPKDSLSDFLDDPAAMPMGSRVRGRKVKSLGGIRMNESERGPSEEVAQSVLVEGLVRSMDGTPQPGMMVTAYPADGSDLFQMHLIRTKSPFMARTDAEGRYRLNVKPGETYYLVARKLAGLAPERGEMFGLYEGNANHSIRAMGSGSTVPGAADILVGPVMPVIEP